MNSIDQVADSPNTPSQLKPPAPLPGFSEQQLAATVRAYSRRSANLASGLSLRGLKAVDQKLIALMEVARYYGPSMLVDLQLSSHKAVRQEQPGLAFVHVALTQSFASDWDELKAVLLQHIAVHPVAVRDALWFFADQDTCAALLDESDDGLARLGVELAGRMGFAQLLPGIYEAANRGVDLDECLLACARLGNLPERASAHISAVLQSHDLARLVTMLDVLAVAGQDILQPELRSCIQRLTAPDGPTEESHPGAWAAVVDTAMSIWSARHPDQALDAVIKGLRIPNATAMRVAAVAGRAEGILPVMAHFEALERALDSAERDVVKLVFGKVPAELSYTLGTSSDRQIALRRLACEVFERNGCSDLKPEHLVRWTDPQLAERLWPLAQIRLRAGRPLKGQHLLADCFDLSHTMRRWLYVAHAHQTGRAFVLSHEDLALRQMQSVEALLLLRGLEAGGDE